MRACVREMRPDKHKQKASRRHHAKQTGGVKDKEPASASVDAEPSRPSSRKEHGTRASAPRTTTSDAKPTATRGHGRRSAVGAQRPQRTQAAPPSQADGRKTLGTGTRAGIGGTGVGVGDDGDDAGDDDDDDDRGIDFSSLRQDYADRRGIGEDAGASMYSSILADVAAAAKVSP